MSVVRLIYFDVGGVMIQDYSSSHKWEHMKVDMGLPPERDQEFEEYYDSIEDALALGNLDIDNAMPDIEKRFGFHFPPDFSMLSYFLDTFERNESIWPVVDLCRGKGVRVGLLTDQYPRLLDGIKQRGLLPPVEWDIEIDSTVVKLKKPMPEIYELAQERAGVKPGEILFVDNKQSNLDVPAKLDWQTHFYSSEEYEKSSQELLKVLSNLL